MNNEEDKKEDVITTDTEDGSNVESVEYDNIQDFMTRTGTKCKMTLVASEPSPIFGPKDLSNHNKYKVTITNDKGSIWFYFWDSTYNTQNGKSAKVEDAIYAFVMDALSVEDGMSFEIFRDKFGYGETEESTARKTYNGCLKMLERANKIFDKEQIEALVELCQEI